MASMIHWPEQDIMGALVVYDTGFGNTAQIANEIADAIPGGGKAIPIAAVDPVTLKDAALLVVGSPTQAGRPTPAMQSWLAGLPSDSFENRRVAAFDTRLSFNDQGFALRLLMKLIGYAAPRMARSLLAKRGILAAEPEGFIVEGREGPLRDGERERARRWAAGLVG